MRRKENRGQRSEVKGPKAEIRGQRSEGRGPRSEVRGQRAGNERVSGLGPPTSDLRPPTSDLGPPTSARRSGQAAIEFVASLLLLLLILTGIIQINRMARTSLFLQAVLRGDAGEQAMQGGALSVSPPYISDWEAGADAVRYTADDQPVRNPAMLPATLSLLSGFSVKNPGDWTYVASDSRLPVSMIRLHSSPMAAATLGFVHAEETLRVPVDALLRQLVYDKDEVAIKEEVWMPLMGGLY